MKNESFLKTERIDVMGINTRLSRMGQGEAVIFIHGFPETLQTWRFILPELSKSFLCIAFDLKGFGYSDKPEGDYSPWGMADFVKDFIDALNITKAHFVATDIGLNIACAFSLRYPERVKKLVLMAGTVRPDGISAQEVKLLSLKPIGELVLYLFSPLVVKVGLAKGFYRKTRISSELFREYHRPLRDLLGKKRALELFRSYDRTGPGLSEDIKAIQHPTLILWAQYENFFHSDEAKKLNKDIKDSRLEIIPDCGHFIQEEKPDIIVELITSFIKGRAL